ncbi:MAG: UMP kinase [Myxococcales bacterium]|nr:UMP kinase [Myxococcales bacterium]
MRYRRVLLKLSGAAMAGGDRTRTFARRAIDHIVGEIMSLRRIGVDVVTVVGGGNIFRGNLANDWKIEQAEADNMGMLGTVINGVLLRAALDATDLEVRLMTAMPIPSMAEPYIRLRAIRHLEKGRVVILSGGIGQPYVTTDYPATQRAIETRCDAVLTAKHGIDAIYDADPKVHPGAKRFKTLSSDDAIRQNLRAMDQSALLLARDHGMPVHVFDFDLEGAAVRLCQGEDVGTLVGRDIPTVQG